jgi:hypothetical protein
MSGSSTILQKFILMSVLAFILIMGLSNSVCAQPSDRYTSRHRAPGTVTAVQGPYTWMDTVYCEGVNYTVPSGYIVCELRSTDSCMVKLQLRSRDSITVRCAANDILRLDILKIYHVGTDSLSASGSKLFVFGIKE